MSPDTPLLLVSNRGPATFERGEDGETGFLVTSAEQCAERALEILREPELGKQLGRAGKEHVRKQFLTPRLLRDWLRIFSGLK